MKNLQVTYGSLLSGKKESLGMRVTNVPVETEKDAWDIVFAYRA